MDVRVVVLAERSTKVLSNWLILDGSPVTSPLWDEVTLNLVRRAREGGDSGAEVFLCFIRKPSENYDSTLLRDCVRTAREHSWGAKVFAVTDQREQLLDDEEAWGVAHEWLDTMLDSGSNDLLQIRELEKNLDRMVRSLRAARKRARERYDFWRRLPPATTWHVAIPQILSSVAVPVTRFLEPYVLHESPVTEGSNLLVVVNQVDEGAQRVALSDALLNPVEFPKERILVATLGVEAKGPLEAFCRHYHLPLTHFRSPLELRFFVQQINQRTRQHADRVASFPAAQTWFSLYGRALVPFREAMGAEDYASTGAEIVELRLVDVLYGLTRFGETPERRSELYTIVASFNRIATEKGKPLFSTFVETERTGRRSSADLEPSSHSGDGFPHTLLLTHAFDPESQPELCLLAARYVASILEEAPYDAEIHIHLAVALPKLRDMMKSMPRLTAWVFLGPAGGPEGLWDVASSCCITPEGWVACFRGLEKGPSLAVLLAGRSEDTAWHFATSGMACAVGLAGEGLSEHFQSPLQELFKRIFENGIDCRWIEAHFSEVSKFPGTGEPKVFCARHP